ncbi:hypothetical protein L533_0780 [Bordetella bronchiseptica OSU553]|nr:hypothetical protein L533_0780 [Bordetella bronchiseptica OSU553]
MGTILGSQHDAQASPWRLRNIPPRDDVTQVAAAHKFARLSAPSARPRPRSGRRECAAPAQP